MNRELYFSYISERLISYSNQVASLAKINCLSINVHSEPFCRDLLNIVFGYELNVFCSANEEGFDLFDHRQKILFQVSSRHDKAKVEDMLSSPNALAHKDYRARFICIGKHDCRGPKASELKNQSGIVFDPAVDFISIDRLLAVIQALDIDKLKDVYDLVFKELSAVNNEKMPSALSFLVKQFNEKSAHSSHASNALPFEIADKVSYNDLDNLEEKFGEYAAYGAILAGIYDAYLKQADDAPRKIFNYLNDFYILGVEEGLSGVKLFYRIIDQMENDVVSSPNFAASAFTREDVRHGCMAVAVDAFVRCKIFKNPREGEAS